MVVSFGGIVVNEWPKSCAYWRCPNVKKFFTELNAEYKEVDGCSLGLMSIVEPTKFIKKPWTLACTSSDFLEGLGNCLCPGVSPSHSHVPCAGRDTKQMEDYTDFMVLRVHKSFRKIAAVIADAKLIQP